MSANVQIQQIILKRGNTAQISSYTGPIGEPIYNTQTKTLHIQDGTTAGGSRLATFQQLANVAANVANIQANTSSLYGNANVVAYLPGYTGNIETINTTLINFVNSNAQIISSQAAGTPNTSSISITANTLHDYSGFYAAENSAAEVYSAQDIQFYANTVGSAPLWTFDSTGNTIIPGYIVYPDSTVQNTAYRGPAGQTSFATVANVTTANTAMKGYVDTQITNLVNNAPAILDTLGELAANLQADESSITRVALGQTAANAQIATLQANVGSYYIWANANTAGLYNSILGANTAWTASAAAQQGLIATLQSNLGGYYSWANANTAGLYNSILGANAAIVTANIALKSYTDNQITTANNAVVSYVNTVNTAMASNVAGANAAIVTANTAMKGYVDAVTTAWTANAATQQGLITTLQSNAATQESEIGAINANIGGFYTYANLNYGTSSYANANVVGYLAGNITVGNATATSFRSNNFLYPNGVSILTGISGTYSNTQVAAYLLGNISTGNVGVASGSWVDFRNTDTNWRMGYGINAYSKTTAITSLDVVVGSGTGGPDGFTVGQTNGASIFELVGYTRNAWFANNITAIGNVTAGNVLATGFFYANGTPFTSSSYGNTQVAAYLVANPQSGTYSNTNVAAYLTTQTFYSNSNVAAYLIANPQTGTYSNANVVANLQNYVTSISTSANITTTANMIAPNYLFANGVNILSTITGGSGTYSNTNVAAYLTTQTFYSNSNVAAYLVANPQGGVYSNANVIANLQNLTTNVVTSANIQAAYFTGNGVGLTGITYNQIGNIYGSSSNVTLQAGSYSWTFDNTGNLTIPTTGNIVYANGAVFTSGSGSGGTIYSNANVVSMLSANTAVFIGNTGVIGNVATGNIQANATAIFLGANTVISNYGSPTFGYATHIGNNVYFDANGVMRYRNTQTGASDLIVAPGTLNWYATGGAVTANTATGYTGATGLYMAISTSGMSLYNGAGITSAGAITIQNATGLVTNQATTGLFQNASTINAATPSGILSVGQSVISAGYLGNVTIGAGTVQTGAVPLTVRASGTYNIIILSGIQGGYNSPPYNNQAVTGGSGTGMTASYSSVGGYVNQASLVVTNPGTGYKNGDIVGLPGGNGSTAQIYNYNSNIPNGTTVGTANYVFGIDGNLALPGNVSHASNSAIFGDFTNSTVNYRTIFRPLAANSNPGVYTAPSGTGTAASWQAANSSNIANASKILIATNGTTDVQLVSGINGTGTYLPLSFLTNGTTQMQLDIGGNLNMVANGNITTAGNITAGNIIANHYGNSIGTTATYSGNVTASSVIASGSSGPQTRFLWDTWQANSTSALSSFTPSGTIGGNATWDSNQAYGLKLTTNTTTQSGYINWNSSSVNYNYDMVITASIGASGGTGADGQWIYFGSNAAITGNPGNTSTYGGIAVMNHYYSSTSQFEVYVNSTQTNIPYIGNGNYVTSGVTLWNASYTSFYNLTLKIRKIQNGNRMLEVYLNEIYQGSVNIGSWTPVGNYFGVAAYTGGSTAQNWVRQLRIDW